MHMFVMNGEAFSFSFSFPPSFFLLSSALSILFLMYNGVLFILSDIDTPTGLAAVSFFFSFWFFLFVGVYGWSVWICLWSIDEYACLAHSFMVLWQLHWPPWYILILF